MAKKLSLLKPELKQKYLRNAVSEHVEYIDVPGDIGIDALQSDIKNGAVHMKELEQLITKKKEPKYILGELKSAVEKQGLIFGASSHRAEHHWFMGSGKDFESDIKEPLSCGDFYWPSEQTQPDHQDLFAKPYPDQTFLEDWLLRTCELIDRYQPKLLYFDWWIQHEAYKPYLRKIAAYYYNRSARWAHKGAICYKHDAMAFGSGIVDVERGKFADAKPYLWQTDTALARNSWCHTTSLDYKSSYELICYLIDVVSKNGNLLLNVGPKADGSFADEDLSILRDIGGWLSVFANLKGGFIYG